MNVLDITKTLNILCSNSEHIGIKQSVCWFRWIPVILFLRLYEVWLQNDSFYSSDLVNSLNKQWFMIFIIIKIKIVICLVGPWNIQDMSLTWENFLKPNVQTQCSDIFVFLWVSHISAIYHHISIMTCDIYFSTPKTSLNKILWKIL